MTKNTPIQRFIHDVSLVNAMTEFVFHLDDYGHRLDPDFFVKLNKRRAEDGTRLNFKDPGVRALFEILDMDSNAVPAPADFKIVFKYESDYHGNPTHHSKLPAIKALVAMKKDNGWAGLNKVLKLSHGIPLSRFFEDDDIHHHPEDTGSVGENCYRIQVTEACISRDGYDLDFTTQWFAVASDCEHALRLVGMIMTGELPVQVSKAFSVPLWVSHIKVFEGQSVVLNIVVKGCEHLQADVKQTFPLFSDGAKSKVCGDLSLIQELVRFAPTLEFENLRHTKGLVLEESLGL